MLGTPYLTGPSDDDPEAIAKDFVAEHRKEFKLKKRHVRKLVVVSSYATAHNGANHVTLGSDDRRLTASSTPVSRLRSTPRVESCPWPAAWLVARPQGRRTSKRRGRWSELQNAAGEDIPKKLPAEGKRGRQLRFENTFAEVANPNPVTAELVWYPTNNGKTVRLAWETDFELDSSRWLVSHVDAVDGLRVRPIQSLPRTRRLRARCSRASTRTTATHAASSRSAAPTGPGSMIGSQAATTSTPTGTSTTATPSATDHRRPRPGTPATRSSTTRGPTPGGPMPMEPASRTDLDAAVTQLFYYTNVMHDWAYGFGFDEVSGNFQIDNFGRRRCWERPGARRGAGWVELRLSRRRRRDADPVPEQRVLRHPGRRCQPTHADVHVGAAGSAHIGKGRWTAM